MELLNSLKWKWRTNKKLEEANILGLEKKTEILERLKTETFSDQQIIENADLFSDMWDDVIKYHGISEKVYQEFKDEVPDRGCSKGFHFMIAFKECFLDKEIINGGFSKQEYLPYIRDYYSGWDYSKSTQIDFVNYEHKFILKYKFMLKYKLNTLTLYYCENTWPSNDIELGNIQFYENEQLRYALHLLRGIVFAIYPMIPKKTYLDRHSISYIESDGFTFSPDIDDTPFYFDIADIDDDYIEKFIAQIKREPINETCEIIPPDNMKCIKKEFTEAQGKIDCETKN